MDYCTRNSMLIALLLVAEFSIALSANWHKEWAANYFSRTPEANNPTWTFAQPDDGREHVKLLLLEKDMAFFGGRNVAYKVSLSDLEQEPVTLEWKPDKMSTDTCSVKGKLDCQNYIRVLVRKSPNLFYICGTNAYQPKCRHYNLENDQFSMSDEEPGTGICPYDPHHNSTTLYTADGSLYSATVADADSRDPLILKKSKKNDLMRTRPRDSTLLNEPNFVSSFEKDNKIVFFFRETAIENINCGKAVFSRVGRVCKKDLGGAITTFRNRFTSFFKARLNCSIPGEYPFYFDEIQSTSDLGQGNYRPTSNSGDRDDMIYAVFNTPQNSIQGSAVCAFMYSDIVTTFRGRFKGQDTFRHNWLPVSWESTPATHPEKCTNNSMAMSYDSLDFIKRYPLMDEAVPATGGQPMLVFTSFHARFTHVAVDWQVLAADGLYYDVMFVGTDDGRVIKAINKGTKEIESVVIEDIQVLEKNEPVTTLRVISNRVHKSEQNLLVMSKGRVKAVPLYRCDRATTCSSCVALQDPYCAWNSEMGQCISAEAGIQNIESGKSGMCPDEKVEEEVVTKEPSVTSECKCSLAISAEEPKVITKSADLSVDIDTSDDVDLKEDRWEVRRNDGKKTGGKADASRGEPIQEAGISADIFVIAIVVSIIFSLLIGFLIGFKVQSCRYARDQDVFYDQHSRSLTRGLGRNRLSSGDNPYFHTDHTTLAPKKQLNHVVNMKSNGKINAETVPVTKSNKVYL